MRIARGMFRLWLVLSSLWIATVAAIGYSNWPSSTVQQAATSKDDPKDSKTYVPEWAKDKDEDPNNAFADFPRPGTNRFAEALKDLQATTSKDPKDKANDSKTYVPEYLKDDPNYDPDPYAKYLKGEHAEQSAKQLAVSTAELALIPPALIFIVGIGLTWAFRGFR